MGCQPRRRPPACSLCRIRKLRCNRQSPCSNCSIRGIPCQRDGSRCGPRLLHDNGSQEVLNRNHLAPSSLASTELQLITAEVLDLQKNCANQKLLDSLAPSSFTLRTRSIRAITKPSYFVQHPDTSTLSEEVTVIKCICLPLREDAHILLEKFIDDVLHFHHIFHTPSLPSIVDQFYDAVEQDENVDLGQLMLILAICCSTTHTWTRYDDAKGLFDCAEYANSQTSGWLKTALDMIHHVHLAAHASLTCIQGIVIVFFMLCSLEGISPRARVLHTQAVAMAQTIGLHAIDSPNAGIHLDWLNNSRILAEVGRRTWWNLTDTDWMISRLSVPQGGSSIIQASQMAVRWPCNANDEDIVDEQEIVDRPLEEATSVSYLLERSRLAMLFYKLGDFDRPINSTSEEAGYLKVMEADMKLRQFMRELPSFFRLENSDNVSKLPSRDSRHSSNITTQRYLLNMIFYGQICKLHLPYMARGTVNPGFAYSHDSCLKAAQQIIYIEHQMRAENSTFILFRQRMNIKFRSIFIACVVFVLDGCLANGAEGGTMETDATMADAWKILHEAKGQSPMASELLQLSIEILKKYKATHPALEMIQTEILSEETSSLIEESLSATHRVGRSPCKEE
ncbi:hypothetical protein M441DRAFT_82483 [Trichoderma asperellum CBS 433.97]|uniref:Zn(2)-C6 fungal-type domain-containing protein n=1 Tax=Trichoderma asperellum (strain ATCC 204424 / CBS 433.97 / NBRC 101777) TaxID=1042311 RepID=A0A2T3Z0I6_TRIA4|nr:hypothetical protein M441DRAFT_82483 [Trichoderma asperellum CBS 433.97]PTB38315.1 hypothetical protein M441DRAFT_82483 [Trichoderma asperellum CBS 433.97]